MNIDRVPVATRDQLRKLSDLPISTQAKRLGLSPNTIRAYRSAMIRSGLLQPKIRSATPADEARIARLAARGLSVRGITERVGLGRVQVSEVLRSVDRTGERWGLKALVALFGVSDEAVRAWRDAGWLALTPARGDEYVKGVAQVASRDELRRFIHVREAWPSYSPALIVDEELRALALQVRRLAGGEWLSLTEIACRASIGVEAVPKRMRHGWLADWPQTRCGRARFVWVPTGAEMPEYVERDPWTKRRAQAKASPDAPRERETP